MANDVINVYILHRWGAIAGIVRVAVNGTTNVMLTKPNLESEALKSVNSSSYYVKELKAL